MPDRRRDDDLPFAYLTDTPDQELADELAYAQEHDLAELAEACQLEQRRRGKQWDVGFVYLGNINEPTSDDE